MRTLVVGDKKRFDELALKLPADAEARYHPFWEEFDHAGYDAIIDLNFDDFPGNIKYFGNRPIPVIAAAVKKRLSEAVREYGGIKCPLIGMNFLPGFIDRGISEISLLDENGGTAKHLMRQFNWKYSIVDDRAGMVTPRIICMIINEACYTLQEGTASIHDMDLAMKSGTNYPLGPFEWADKIGIKDVYETLAAIYNDTHDERYKICPLLKTKYLKDEAFY